MCKCPLARRDALAPACASGGEWHRSRSAASCAGGCSNSMLAEPLPSDWSRVACSRVKSGVALAFRCSSVTFRSQPSPTSRLMGGPQSSALPPTRGAGVPMSRQSFQPSLSNATTNGCKNGELRTQWPHKVLQDRAVDFVATPGCRTRRREYGPGAESSTLRHTRSPLSLSRPAKHRQLRAFTTRDSAAPC